MNFLLNRNLFIFLLFTFLLAACQSAEPEPTSTPEPEPVEQPTETAVPPTDTPEPEPEPTEEPTAVPEPTEEPTSEPTVEPTPEAYQWPAPTEPYAELSRETVTEAQQRTYNDLNDNLPPDRDDVLLAAAYRGVTPPTGEAPLVETPLNVGTRQEIFVSNTDTIGSLLST